MVLRCCVYSGKPTPPEWGTIGIPNLNSKQLSKMQSRSATSVWTYFFAISMTASPSLTPPNRQASIWHTSMAWDARSCLKITRFWHISPVATPIPKGNKASRIALCPSTSSGEVGSSMNHGLKGARCSMYSIASGTDHTYWSNEEAASTVN